MNAPPHDGVLSEDRMLVCHMTNELNEFHEEPVAPKTHGNEFSSDDSGDGPNTTLSFEANHYLEQVARAKNKPKTSGVLTQTTISPLVRVEGRYDLGPNTPGGLFWNYGLIGRKVLTSKHEFLVTVSKERFSCAPGLFDYCCDQMGWDGTGSLVLTINFTEWPSERDVYASKIDMMTGVYCVAPRHMKPDGSMYRLVASRTDSNNICIGDSRDCWGTGHALQREYGNSEGNPNKRARIGESFDNVYSKILEDTGPEDIQGYMNVLA